MYIAFMTIVLGGDEDDGRTAFDEPIVSDGHIVHHTRLEPTACIVCYQDAAHLHSEESVVFYQYFTSCGN